MSAHLPRRIPHTFRRQCLFQQRPLLAIRPFSSTVLRGKAKPNFDDDLMEAFMERMKKKRAGMSPRAMMIQQQAKNTTASFFDDVGVFPGTIIRPSWRQLPGLFSNTKQRLSYEWLWFKTRFQDWIGRMYYKFWISSKKPRPKLIRRPVIAEAKKLHEEMYTVFANRDDNRLREICCLGLYNNFLNAAPGPDEVMSWRLLRYLSRPRVVSNRASPLPLPGDKEAAMRQVVVKIHTRQVVEKWSRKAEQAALGLKAPKQKRVKRETGWAPKTAAEKKDPVDTEVKAKEDWKKVVEKDVVEYVVMQRLMRKGVEQEWKVWGFAEESTMERVEEEKKKLEALQEWEAHHPSP